MTRDDVYLTNTVKCRAAVEEGGRMKNRPPKTGEINACNPYLQAQMDAVKPEIILCLGGPGGKDPHRQELQDHQRPRPVARVV